MKQEVVEKFKEIFGEDGEIRTYFAPGRVNLIGEHTDYNGGHVFPCALTIGTYAAVRLREDQKLCFYSMNFEKNGMIESSLDELKPEESAGWTNYPKGVIWSFLKKGYKINKGFDIVIYGNIPNGSGLSSSASLEVLIGLILKDLFLIEEMTMIDVALLSQYAENNFNGMNCGIMDQFASAMGKKDHAIFLDTATLKYEYANIVLKGAKIVITNSKIKHALVDSAYNERREQSETALKELQEVIGINGLGDLTEEQFEQYRSSIHDEVRQMRAKHAVYENQRTIKAVQALKDENIELFGELMNQSHISLRDDYEVSCDEIDVLVEEAWKLDGVIGSRITGGGFGGCTVSIVKDEEISSFQEKLSKAYKEKVGIDCEFYVVDIGDGAGRL
ncbi:MAG: galactokinase [Lachnospiraceae bacterium]|nr:galactokinase [Lachnospiraceae bacterium]